VLTGRTGGNLTVKELVSLGRHPHTHWSGKLNSEDIQKIEDAIEKTHMELLQNRKLYTLSDGQLQKAMIARALAQDSAIMILDEPTAHLDLNNRMEIMDLFIKWPKKPIRLFWPPRMSWILHYILRTSSGWLLLDAL